MEHDCPNCLQPLPKKAMYCPHCGQRNADGKESMKALLGKLWDSTFHLESKFIRTAWQLFVPGLITKEYFKGKQSRYPHPLRFFGIVMFFFLLVINRSFHSNGVQQSGLNFSFNSKSAADTVKKVDSETYYQLLQEKATLEDFRKNYPELPPSLRSQQTQQAMDSLSVLYARQHGQPDFSLADTTTDTLRIQLAKRMFSISYLDIVRYDPDTIVQRLGPTNWLQKIFIHQAIKSFKSPEALGHAFLGSLTWTILALITFMAAILALLYWRQRRFYVEHFIFLLHLHTSMLLMLTIGILIAQTKMISTLSVLFLVTLIVGVGIFFALYRYYDQKVWKTLVKWALFNVVYVMSTMLFFVLGLVVVFASY